MEEEVGVLQIKVSLGKVSTGPYLKNKLKGIGAWLKCLHNKHQPLN
jgi:hypothetical protein